MTTNEMILATIKTKLTKTPKYKAVLEDMGYEVFDSTWSSYGNWSVRNPKTERLVCLSKGYDNKRRLYGGAWDIKTKDISKVDFVNYLRKEKPKAKEDTSYSHYYHYFSTPLKTARFNLEDAKRMKESYERHIKETKEKICKLEQELEDYEKSLRRYEDQIRDIRKQFGLKYN